MAPGMHDSLGERSSRKKLRCISEDQEAERSTKYSFDSYEKTLMHSVGMFRYED